MSFKSWIARLIASRTAKSTEQWSKRAIEIQERTLKTLVNHSKHTRFGLDHDFASIRNHEQFMSKVPVRDYEELSPWVEMAKKGEPDILWSGKPLYFAKTSGTTSGAKYIPITPDSIGNHINSARNALLNYIHRSGNSKFLDGNMIFLSGSPELGNLNGIHTGRLSGIVNHHIPSYLKNSQVPTYKTNCIEDWEEKLEAIVGETLNKDMSLISGIPPWVQMYFDKIHDEGYDKVIDLFPNFSLFVYGGVNFKPYKEKLVQSIGKEIDFLELFPASEGFLAYNDYSGAEGMLLLVNEGIYYEFIPLDQIHSENPIRLPLSEVQVGINYAMVLSSNAGLWAYDIGDTVQFTSIDPYRLVVSGRVKHFISAFGEHVIGHEVDECIRFATKKMGMPIREYHVAPVVNPEQGLPHHQWLIEGEKGKINKTKLAALLDRSLSEQNSYYRDLREGNIIKEAEVIILEQHTFINYMNSIGKLGGQNKVPRLANDRAMADRLLQLQ